MDSQAVARALHSIATQNGHKKPELSEEEKQALKDRKVWEEEEQTFGPVIIPDIRDPRVRAEVKRVQKEQEAKLEERLIAAGLHIMQRKG